MMPLNAEVETPEQELARAWTAFRQRRGRLFPTWSEILEILRELGYRKLVHSNPD